MRLIRAAGARWATAGTAAVALLAAVAVAPTAAAAPAPGRVLNAGAPDAVTGSYIVVFKDASMSAAAVSAEAQHLASANAGAVGFTYSAALRGFEAKVSAPAAARIAADPAVAYVEQSTTVRTAGVQPNPPSWGLDRIDQDFLPLDQSFTYPNTGAGVHAYIIDTGIRLTHNTFQGRARSGYDAVDGGSADDCNGHGTHVAGTVGGEEYGVAKDVELVAVRVLSCIGLGTTAQVVAGVDWVTANAVKPAVANMSLGGGANTSIDAAVRNSIASGVTYSVAAGNDDKDACATSPARVGEAITVGSTDIDDLRSSYSNYGGCLDLFAPGRGIKSAWWLTDSSTKTISGTSMAAPHVTGAAALVLSVKPAASPATVSRYLVNQAVAGVVRDPGPGSPNRLL